MDSNFPEGSTSAINNINLLIQQPIFNLNLLSASRVLISGLPSDVTASQLHELFDQTVSLVQTVEVYCDQSGTSRGTALIEFGSLESALKAHQQFHGKLIDKVSTITVEILAIPAPPSALERPPPPPPPPPHPAYSASRTTTIKPPAHLAQQPHHHSVPLAPRPKNYSKNRPPPSKLSLKQRLALPSPPPPRRFLFTTTPSSSTTTIPKGPKAASHKKAKSSSSTQHKKLKASFPNPGSKKARLPKPSPARI